MSSGYFPFRISSSSVFLPGKLYRREVRIRRKWNRLFFVVRRWLNIHLCMRTTRSLPFLSLVVTVQKLDLFTLQKSKQILDIDPVGNSPEHVSYTRVWVVWGVYTGVYGSLHLHGTSRSYSPVRVSTDLRTYRRPVLLGNRFKNSFGPDIRTSLSSQTLR